MAVDDGARGTGGVAVDGSMGPQKACGGGNGIWIRTGDMAGAMTGDGGGVGAATLAWRP